MPTSPAAVDVEDLPLHDAVRTTLRAEGLLLLVAACAAYFHFAFSGPAFALYFLVPDLSMLGYLAGPRAGAVAYNAAHAMIGPLALLALGIVVVPALVPYALIWLAHIGFDRTLGYGLKHGTGFRFTHLGTLGNG